MKAPFDVHGVRFQGKRNQSKDRLVPSVETVQQVMGRQMSCVLLVKL